MKQMKFVVFIIAAMILVLGITACDTGSSSDPNGDDIEGAPLDTGTDLPVTERSLTPLTIGNLVGTWAYPEEESFIYDYPGNETIETENTKIVKQHFFSDSTYVEETIYIFTNTADPDEKYYYYAYQKGSIAIEGNNITYTATHYIYFTSEQETDFDSAPWDKKASPNRSIDPVFIYNDGLYTNVFTRITEGTGLLGTWQSIEQNPDYTEAPYFLTQVSFDENGQHNYSFVANTSGLFEDFSTISDSTYEFTEENIFNYIDTEHNSSGTYEVFLSGNLLALTGGYPQYCYTKEAP